MDSVLVIKVKYGDTLRRFNVRVDENNCLDINMVGLRAKICSIFNFAVDANLILRYVDEDGDLVNLMDDDDLHDVMRQQLKFLRIDVHMINSSGGKSDADGSCGSATPLSSPPVSDPFLIGKFIKADALQALPDPLRQILYLSFSKAASSNTLVADIADSISKIGQSILKPQRQPQFAGGSSSKNDLSEGPQSPCVDSASDASDYAKSSGTAIPPRSHVPDPFKSENVIKTNDSNSGPEAVQKAFSNLSLSKPASSRQPLPNFTDSISKMGQSASKSHYRGPLVAAGPSSKNDVLEELVTSEARGQQSPFLNSASDGNRQVAAFNFRKQVEAENVGVAPIDLNIPPCDPYSSSNVNRVPLSSAVPVSYDKGKATIGDSFAGKDERCGTSMNSAPPNNSPAKSPSINFSAPFDCPFSGTHTLHSIPPPLGNVSIPPFKRSHSYTTDAVNGMFHKGVCCDGCGVDPITGPRFISKIKENYDLCRICFNEIGNHTDYIRMDCSASFRGPRSSYHNTKEFRHLKIPPPVLKTGALLKHARPKLDSRFILDVNVIDGTMMAPSTPFTKIWRMRNNGTLVWPKGTQLVWIGGDKLSDMLSVDLEVSEDGVPVEKELDIAVDFIAPQLPGRYISYWRMASLSGHKFGQRVWVLIQVDASLKDSFYDSSQGLNLNIPLGVGSSEGRRVIDINVQPIEDNAFYQAENPNAPPELVSQMLDEEQRQELKNEFPTNEATFVAPAASAPSTSVAPSSVSYPIIDFSSTDPFFLDMDGNDGVEEVLLKELEDMGFEQVNLNKEVLRMNAYNLEQSIEELCGVSEWDPTLLEELHEMGFHDRDTNKRLLMKHRGSIKRVVMDLINGE